MHGSSSRTAAPNRGGARHNRAESDPERGVTDLLAAAGSRRAYVPHTALHAGTIGRFGGWRRLRGACLTVCPAPRAGSRGGDSSPPPSRDAPPPHPQHAGSGAPLQDFPADARRIAQYRAAVARCAFADGSAFMYSDALQPGALIMRVRPARSVWGAQSPPPPTGGPQRAALSSGSLKPTPAPQYLAPPEGLGSAAASLAAAASGEPRVAHAVRGSRDRARVRRMIPPRNPFVPLDRRCSEAD